MLLNEDNEKCLLVEMWADFHVGKRLKQKQDGK